MNDDSKTWIEAFSEGGLPQMLLGPAGMAISRLIGAAVEIPASWLDAQAEKTKIKSSSYSIIAEKIAESAGTQAANDPDVIERALNNFIAKEYRSQRNKDSVAMIAVKDLAQTPPPEDSLGPSEQFMENFEHHAEKAASEELRLMFGRLLAGEIREPSSISPATLNFVSLLDQEAATLVSSVIPYCMTDVAVLDSIQPRLNVAQVTDLEQLGFWSAGKSIPVSFDERGLLIKLTRKNHGFFARGEPGGRGRLEVALLSRPAIDLVRSSDIPCDYQALANAFLKKGATSFVAGPAFHNGDNVTVRKEKEYLLDEE